MSVYYVIVSNVEIANRTLNICTDKMQYVQINIVFTDLMQLFTARKGG